MKLPLPRQEYEILLCHVYQISPAELYAHPARYNDQDTRYQTLLQRRLKNEPVAYIVGYQPFLGLKFFVDRSVLIPRPETEILAQLAIDLKPKTAADIGTGSGAIAVSIAKNLPETKVIGIDSSSEAIRIAEKNAKYHGVNDRCQFIVGNMFEPLDGGLKTAATSEITSVKNVAATFRSPCKLDLIVSNPPYIPTEEIDKLQPEVKDWEPKEALDGGEDGLHYIRQLIEKSPGHLNSNGLLLMEIGFGQAENIRILAKKYFSKVEIFKDLAEIDRILKACN